MKEKSNIGIRPPLTGEDRQWLRDLWVSEWGGETMVTRGKTHHVGDLEAFIAWDNETRVGAATYHPGTEEWELLSLNATVGGSGIGTMLLTAFEQAARQAGVRRVWLITSNDNLDALRFYQRRGYRIVAVHPGAIDEARKRKPAIPLVGSYNIPIHDELELEKKL
ncbi:GNAT family N-acetyltransferase [Staphylospora marina]|uniref:GNAT family N-acetyltransferase n=1 Tax=Staphylospora marina TaxID=2490858 RepID=UPI000F5BAC1B|nr:GNAT family N-acetyltransferase [Staphylospora marina]